MLRKMSGSIIMVLVAALLSTVIFIPYVSYAASEDDILGRWERFGDGAEGTIVEVEKINGKYEVRLEKATGTLVDLGFAQSDIKWKDMIWKSGTSYEGKDMFRFDYGGYEYRNAAFYINPDGVLQVSVANSGDTDVIIGTYQTWRKISSNKIVLKIGNQYMTVNGMSKEIDPGRGTGPVIVDNRTLIPIRALVEELGGSVDWDGNERKVTVSMNSKVIELWIDKKSTSVNGIDKETDVAPQIMNSRTMIPLRYVIDNLGYEVAWDGTTRTITVYY